MLDFKNYVELLLGEIFEQLAGFQAVISPKRSSERIPARADARNPYEYFFEPLRSLFSSS
jgi:hypothetical protein